jgi:hypothetical protein
LGSTAFVAGREAGVYAVDIAGPAHLRLTGHLNTPGRAWRVSAYEDRLYVADGEGGLLVLQIKEVGR